ncbi:maleylpyruvate isomerase family mycothiol-dependent enzyme [Micromonospora sp. NBC_01813]|uniref:maleylpyruvate isomerase family mycothiol-dependent enzyme n=1 Tax=Micromonospora sp. NBC_01813 TaxID=2975988 RepID=UPI002DDC371E|nr:maleylpyruvate isomerase family mycothiol-dependent enzyme [Micromonospora sp. NBC_01813]WSA09239.1 maleylpyruvate isomerase family mycothiol-dependent enzyme [Micromonospora sp. NBC_01813]
MTGNSLTHMLLLRTAGGQCDLEPKRLLDVFADQRRRLRADLGSFGPEEWAAPTRCPGWSAHDVVRHLCDVTRALTAGPGDRTYDMHAGFDPRTTPSRWLAASAGESPAATLDRLAATTDEALVSARERLTRDDRFDVVLPYGPMDWTVQALHVLWDSWLHERDIFLALRAGRPADAEATGYASAYGLFIAAAVAHMFGDGVSERLVLGGDGGGVFELDTNDSVTLTVTRTATDGPPAAAVTDALAGRGSAAVLDGLPDQARTALTHLATFFTTEVDET